MKVELVRDVELGRTTAAHTRMVHVVAERGETLKEDAGTAEIRFPERGKAGDVMVAQGHVCVKCVRALMAEERARDPKESEAPPKRKAPANPLNEIAELKVQYLAGMIDWSTYAKDAHRAERRAREAGLLVGGGSVGQ